MSKTKLDRQINDYFTYCRDVRRFTPASLETKMWTINNFRKFLPERVKSVSDITTNDVLRYLATFTNRGRTGKTVNSRRSELLPFLRYYLDMGTPMPKLKLCLIKKAKEDPPRRNHFTEAQIDRALQCANQIEWLLIKLAFDCGLRLSELANLRLSNINGQIVKVVGKGRKMGVMRMTTETRERLDLWVESRDVTDYLWESPVKKGRPLRKTTIYRYLKRCFRRAGIDGFYPHALRHSFATNMQRKGATPMELQVMLRHSSVNTSMRYLHGLDGKEEDIFKKYEEGAVVGAGGDDLRTQLLNTAKMLSQKGDAKSLKKAANIYDLLADL